jgi:hypothetical protein
MIMQFLCSCLINLINHNMSEVQMGTTGDWLGSNQKNEMSRGNTIICMYGNADEHSSHRCCMQNVGLDCLPACLFR